MAVLADVRKRALDLLREVHGGFWRVSVFATFICFVPRQRPRIAKRTNAELRMAVLTLLKERSV